jgi:hypothetical protein
MSGEDQRAYRTILVHSASFQRAPAPSFTYRGSATLRVRGAAFTADVVDVSQTPIRCHVEEKQSWVHSTAYIWRQMLWHQGHWFPLKNGFQIMKCTQILLMTASLLLPLSITGCIVDDSSIESTESTNDSAEMFAELDNELISTSLRGVASRANTNLCFENVNAQVRLRPCVAGRNQQKVEAEVIDVFSSTLRFIKLRANSGNCFSAGVNPGNFVVLRPCGESTSWLEFDFSGNSVFVSNGNTGIAIGVNAAVNDEPVRVLSNDTGSNRQRWFNK